MEKRIRITFSIEELQAIIDQSVKTALKELLNAKTSITDKKSTIDNSVLLSRQESASFLKISLVTLYDWTKSGILKSYKIGGRVYYKQDELVSTAKQVVNRRNGT